MLEINNISFSYDAQPLLKNISFNIKPGEILGVIGPNGVGKSTLIRVISGIVPVDSGRVLVGHNDIKHMSQNQRARHIAVVSQNVTLPAAFTGWEIVLLGRTPYLGFLGSISKSDEQVTAEAMQLTHSWHLRDKYVNHLSGGEKQLLMLARALAQSAPVLLLDEPTAHLDLKYQVEMLNHVKELTISKQLAVVVVMHDLNLVARYADQIALISRDNRFWIGSPHEILQEKLLSEVYQLELKVYEQVHSTTPLILPDPNSYPGVFE